LNTSAQDDRNRINRDRALAQMVVASSLMYEALPTEELVRTARQLDDRRRNAPLGSQYRAALAASCIRIYNIVERRRIHDDDLAPVRGPAGIFAGHPEQNAVFHMLDIWAGEAAQYRPLNVRRRPSRRPSTVEMEEELITVPRHIPGPAGVTPSVELEGVTATVALTEGIRRGMAVGGAVMTVINLILLAQALNPLASPVAAVSGPLALGLAWYEVDEINRFQGRVEGFANAMQDMANGYSDASLNELHYNDLPPRPAPRPHSDLGTRTGLLAELFRRGEQEGLNEAVRCVDNLKNRPQTIELTDDNDQAVGSVEMDDRLYLLLLRRRFGDRVRRNVISALRQRMQQNPDIPQRWIRSLP
jgi:hypothetical protein